MAAPAAGSKKELVLSLARKDPFLRIEEIARLAGTTPPYVRTILSEGRVSLSRLRKAYAEEMERRLGSAGGRLAEGDGIALDALEAGAVPASRVSVAEIVGSDAERLLAEWGMAGSPPLVSAARAYKSKGGVDYVRRVTVPTARCRAFQQVRSEGDLLVSAAGGAPLLTGRVLVEVGRAESGAALLGEGPDALFLVVRWSVTEGGRAIALEECLFRAQDACLVLSSSLGQMGVRPRATLPGDARAVGS